MYRNLITIIFVFMIFLLPSSAQDNILSSASDWEEIAVMGRGVISEAKLSPDGTQIAVATSQGVWIYSSEDLSDIAYLNSNGIWIRSVFWSQDSSTIVAGGDDKIYRWDVLSGELLEIYDSPFGLVDSVALTDDGIIVLLYRQDVIAQVWNLKTNTVLLEILSYHEGTGKWSPDGEHLAYLSNKSVLIWNASSATITEASKIRYGTAKLSWSSQSILMMSARARYSIAQYDVDTGDAVAYSTESSWSKEYMAGALSPNKEYVALVTGSGIYVINNLSDEEDKKTSYDFFSSRSLFWSLDSSKLYGVSSDNTLAIWDLHIEEITASIDYHHDVVQIDWSSDSQMVASLTSSGTINMWDRSTGISLQFQAKNRSNIKSFAWSPDSIRIAEVTWRFQINIHDILTDEIIQTIDSRELSIVPELAEWSPDGRDLMVGGYGTISVVNLENPSEIQFLVGHGNDITSLSWIAEPPIIASSASSLIKIWDLETSEAIKTFGTTRLTDLALSPTGEYLATSHEDNVLRIWSIESGNVVRVLQGHTSNVNSVTWSMDGSVVASGSDDSTVKLWDSHTGQLLASFDNHSASVNDVEWSPNGEYLASSSDDGTIRLYGLPD